MYMSYLCMYTFYKDVHVLWVLMVLVSFKSKSAQAATLTGSPTIFAWIRSTSPWPSLGPAMSVGNSVQCRI